MMLMMLLSSVLIISETVMVWQEPNDGAEQETPQLYWDNRDCTNVAPAGLCSNDFVNGGRRFEFSQELMLVAPSVVLRLWTTAKPSVNVKVGKLFLCRGPHMICECALRAEHPVCMIYNHNFTVPSLDTYLNLLVAMPDWATAEEEEEEITYFSVCW